MEVCAAALASHGCRSGSPGETWCYFSAIVYVFMTARVFHDRPAQVDPPGPLSPGHPVVGPDSIARCVARSKHGGQAFARGGPMSGQSTYAQTGLYDVSQRKHSHREDYILMRMATFRMPNNRCLRSAEHTRTSKEKPRWPQTLKRAQPTQGKITAALG